MAQAAAGGLVESAWAVLQSLALAIPLTNRLYCNHLP
jgi:hypothetical protein